MSSNLFIDYHELISSLRPDALGEQDQVKRTAWENAFTKGLLHYLRADPEGMGAFLHLLLGDSRYEEAAGADREVSFGGGSERPDLVITLSSGRLLVIENKIHAGLGSRQLERYLSIASTGCGDPYVALISHKPQDVSDDVTSCDRYLRPNDQRHFVWNAVHDRLAALERRPLGPAAIRSDFVQYMLHTGLGWVRVGPKESRRRRGPRADGQRASTRPMPLAPVQVAGNWHRLFLDSTDPENAAVRRAFGAGWEGLDSWLEARGLKTSGNGMSGRFAHPPPLAAYRQITLSPVVTPRHLLDSRLNGVLEDAVVDIRFVFDGRKLPAVASALAAQFQDGIPWSDDVVWYPMSPEPNGSAKWRVRFLANLAPFLDEDSPRGKDLTDASVALLSRVFEWLDASRATWAEGPELCA